MGVYVSHDNIWVCQDCAYTIANGYPDDIDDDRQEEIDAGLDAWAECGSLVLAGQHCDDCDRLTEYEGRVAPCDRCSFPAEACDACNEDLSLWWEEAHPCDDCDNNATSERYSGRCDCCGVRFGGYAHRAAVLTCDL